MLHDRVTLSTTLQTEPRELQLRALAQRELLYIFSLHTYCSRSLFSVRDFHVMRSALRIFWVQCKYAECAYSLYRVCVYMFAIYIFAMMFHLVRDKLNV